MTSAQAIAAGLDRLRLPSSSSSLVVVAMLLTLILSTAQADSWRGVGDLDRRAEGREQHHPPRAARSDEPRGAADPRSRLSGSPLPRASSRRMRRRVPAVRTASSARSGAMNTIVWLTVSSVVAVVGAVRRAGAFPGAHLRAARDIGRPAALRPELPGEDPPGSARHRDAKPVTSRRRSRS